MEGHQEPYNNVAKYAMPHTRVYVEVRKIGCRIIFDVKNISERPLNSIKAEELTGGDLSEETYPEVQREAVWDCPLPESGKIAAWDL